MSSAVFAIRSRGGARRRAICFGGVESALEHYRLSSLRLLLKILTLSGIF